MLGPGAGPCTLIHATVAATAGADPAALFPAGHDGLWLDPSDLSTMFQDVAGTMPVTSPGDPVRLLQDKSGNGNDVVAPSDAARPVYQEADGLHWLEFDGVDDELATVMPLPFATEIFNCTAFRSLSFSSSYPHIVCNRSAAGGSENRHPLVFLSSSIADSVTASFGGNGRRATIGTAVTGLDIVAHALASASETEVHANGAVTLGAGVTLTDGSTDPFTIAGPNKANIRFYGTMQVNGVPSNAQIAAVRAYFASKSGQVA
jgi:hypothetical protein